MQPADAFLMTLAVAGAVGPAWTRRQENVSAPSIVRRADIERDLELVAHLQGAAPVYSWWPLSISVELVNRSKTVGYPIVMPGDGSDADWREPHVYFSADLLLKDGTWTTMPPALLARNCGNYDPNWLDEVVVLAPGESRRLVDWMPDPRLPKGGEFRIRAHYQYKARSPAENWSTLDASSPPTGFGGMQGVEPFELVSAPIELELRSPGQAPVEIERALGLELTREGPTAPFSWEPVRFRVKLINRSPVDAHRVVRPSFIETARSHEPQLWPHFEIDPGEGRWRHAERLQGGFYDGPIGGNVERSQQVDWRPQVVELAPGRTIEFELPARYALYDFTGARAARFTLEYSYSGIPIVDANGAPVACPDALGGMAAVPPFRVRSNEVTWQVRSPLTLEILPRPDVTRGSSIADHLEVVLRNASDEAIELSNAQRPASLELSVQGLRRGQDTLGGRSTLVFGALVIPANGELSLLQESAIDPAASSAAVLRTEPGSKPPHAEALLHRAEWLHAFRATWREGG